MFKYLNKFLPYKQQVQTHIGAVQAHLSTMSTTSEPNTTDLAPYPENVHFVGSVPLPSSEDTFARIAAALPGHLKRIPDGETGLRGGFSEWLKHVFLPAPFVMRPYDLVFARLPAGAQKEPPPPGQPVTLGPTHYDTVAVESYKEFKKLRESGAIAKGVRFQVSIPTPVTLIPRWVTSEFLAVAEKPYEERVLEAVRGIQEAIPHEDLAIQWDMPVEFAMLEGIDGPMNLFRPWFGKAKGNGKREVFAEIIERLVRLGNSVAPGVELGYHFCYGDMGHRHFKDPSDTAVMVRVANTLFEEIGRPINFIHLPVPKKRTDEAFFRPLKDLKAQEGVTLDLCLGLVHPWDVPGTQKRIQEARKTLKNQFSIATECGFGRTDEYEFDEVLSVCNKIFKSKP